MHKFILASGNTHKALEFNELFDANIIEISSAPQKISVVEDGETFQENALKKAQAYFEEFRLPVMSDDSGLCVEALPDQLGIHSARFGGDGLNDEDRARLLLKKLDTQENRSAYFVCVLCFYISPKEIYLFEGRMNGNISTAYIGEDGFGYDPVFIPERLEGRTVAQEPEWKSKNSHRYKACQEAQKFFAAQKK